VTFFGTIIIGGLVGVGILFWFLYALRRDLLWNENENGEFGPTDRYDLVSIRPSA
jgi:hypothetical protein